MAFRKALSSRLTSATLLHDELERRLQRRRRPTSRPRARSAARDRAWPSASPHRSPPRSSRPGRSIGASAGRTRPRSHPGTPPRPCSPASRRACSPEPTASDAAAVAVGEAPRGRRAGTHGPASGSRGSLAVNPLPPPGAASGPTGTPPSAWLFASRSRAVDQAGRGRLVARLDDERAPSTLRHARAAHEDAEVAHPVEHVLLQVEPVAALNCCSTSVAARRPRRRRRRRRSRASCRSRAAPIASHESAGSSVTISLA